MSDGTGAAPACGCRLSSPPERRWLDRLARWCESQDEATTPADTLVDLGAALGPGVAVPEPVRAFFARPGDYAIENGVDMTSWSRVLMAVFGAVFRQCRVPDRGGFEGYEVCQRIYRDERGRTHWDRYARVDGEIERLFIARLEAGPGHVDETFVLWGVPVRLTFEPRVEGDDVVVLKLAPLRSSPFAWLARVEYRTHFDRALGVVRTQGDFRVPWMGLRVLTEFRARLLPRS